MRKKCVFVILVSILFISALDNTQTFRAEISPTPTIPQQEHFIVQQTFWAFGGAYIIGSFNANSGDYIVLNISSVNVDPDRPDDRYVVELDIVSAKHGTSYVSDTQFSQTIMLNYTDYYTITAEKHQFWSSVRISGELTVYYNPVPLETPSPSPSPSPTPSPNPLHSPSISVPPSSSPTPTPAFTGSNMVADPMMDFTPTLMLLAVITLTAAIGIVAYFCLREL
jgi:hypothetical protein